MTDSKKPLTFNDIKDRLPDLREADLRGADLSGANLSNISLCGATIDGAKVRPEAVGGPGHILCALTESEWQMIKEER